MTLMDRRRALMATQKKEAPIPIGANLYDTTAADWVDNKWINNATVGTKNYTFGGWNVYCTSGLMPYRSDYIFATTNATAVNSKLVVLSEDGTVLYFGTAIDINGTAGQALIRGAEESYGQKAVGIRVSTAQKYLFTYRRSA